MKQDTLIFDSLDSRPLPKWLTDQRDGLNQYQPGKQEMRKDSSLHTSLITTGVVIVLTVIILTIFFSRKNKKRK